jgi:GT2 family glycosyltransferase
VPDRDLSLAVIVPASDSPATLDRCLEAIRTARRAPDELIVVTQPNGAGPAHVRNAGAAQAESDLLAFIDADVVVHPDVFARMRDAFAADPGLTALFGSYDAAPEAPGAVSGFRNLLHHHVHHEAAGPASTFWAGIGAVRRDAFDQVGGFDAERYAVPSIEDVELGMRLADAGARIELDPSIQGTHLKRWSLAAMARTDLLRRGVPWVALLIERREASTTLNLGWRHRASALASLAGIGALLARRPGLAAAAVLTLVALNGSFYGLLLRTRGPLEAGAGVGLHLVHHALGAAAVPAGALAATRSPRS